MPNFKIKDTVKVMMAYIYDVEAETKEEALRMYQDGEILETSPDCFVVPDLEESTTVFKQ